MTTTTMTIFDEVFAVAKTEGVKEQGPGQTDQDFLLAVAKAIAGCPEEAWNGLSVSAQTWYDNAAKEVKALKPITSPSGFNSKSRISVPPLPSVAPPPPPPPPPQVKLQEPAKVHVESQAPAEPKVKAKPEGVISSIRKTIILNPDWTTRRVHEYLVANGWPNLKIDVVSVNAGDIRKTVEMAKSLGKWKD